jgi:hypothetical protein
VWTPLDDPSLFHDQELVGVKDRGEPVCNDKAGAVPQQTGQRLLDELLRLAVRRRGCFVQDQDPRVLSSARAMASRCRCPLESLAPRSLTAVSYRSGKVSTNG